MTGVIIKTLGQLSTRPRDLINRRHAREVSLVSAVVLTDRTPYVHMTE